MTFQMADSAFKSSWYDFKSTLLFIPRMLSPPSPDKAGWSYVTASCRHVVTSLQRFSWEWPTTSQCYKPTGMPKVGLRIMETTTDIAHNFLVCPKGRHTCTSPTSGSQQAFERKCGNKSMLGKAAMLAQLPTAVTTFWGTISDVLSNTSICLFLILPNSTTC